MTHVDAPAPPPFSNGALPLRRFRFSLRHALAFTSLVCVILAMGPYQARRHDERKAAAAKMIHSLGGTIVNVGSSLESSPGTNWVSLWMGYGEPMESRWKVDLSDRKLSDDQWRQVGGCEWIRVLNLSGTSISDESLVHIAKIRKLRDIALVGTGITDAGVTKLKALEHLWLLDVRLTDVTYNGLAELEKSFPGTNFQEQLALTRVAATKGIFVHRSDQYVNVGDSDKIDVFPPPSIPSISIIHFTNLVQLTPQNVEDLRHLTSARTLFAEQGLSQPDGPSLLSSLTNLESVDLGESRGALFSDDIVIQLAELPKLRRLDLYGSQLTDINVAPLAGARQLQVLSIHGAQLTPRFLGHLRGLVNLRELTLNFWRKRRDAVDPQEIAVARVNIKHLAAMSALRELHLSGDLITDEVVAELAGFRSLDKLDVDGRFVSAAAVADLQAMLPKCQIHRSER